MNDLSTTGLGDLEDEIIAEFISENLDNLESIESDLLQLAGEEGDDAIIQQIFRTMHSLKGTGGFFQLKTLVHLSHGCETMLSQIRNQELSITEEIVDLLLAATDRLKIMLHEDDLGEKTPIQDLLDNIDKQLSLGSSEPGPSEKPAVTRPVKSKDLSSPSINQFQEKVVKQSAPPKTIRLSVSVLDELLELIGDVVLGRNQMISHFQQDSSFLNLSQSITKLHKQVIQTRMQPIGTIFDKFNRIVRDCSKKAGKLISLHVEGSEIKLDRTLLENFTAPLTHLIRNSIDHGIESTDLRQINGKSRQGNIYLRAYHESGQIVIEVEDDGGGIDPEIIREKALSKGIIHQEAAESMDKQELIQLIYHPGFSTRDQVSELSGRGVGMDVVKSSFESLGCELAISTNLGQGTLFSARLPLSQAIVNSSVISALIIGLGKYKLAIPQLAINEMIRLKPEERQNAIHKIDGETVLRLRDRIIPLISLKKVLNLWREEMAPAPEQGSKSFVIIRHKQHDFAIAVDQILATQEIVVKRLPQLLKQRSVFDGTTILNQGEISMILNINGIVEEAGLKFEQTQSHEKLLSFALKASREEQQKFVIFSNAPGEFFALPMQLIDGVYKIQNQTIKQVGSREMIHLNGKNWELTRMEHSINMTPVTEQSGSSLVIIPDRNSSIAIPATSIVGHLNIHEELQIQAPDEPGLVGSIFHENRIILIPDVNQLLDRKKLDQALLPFLAGYESSKLLFIEDTVFYRFLVRNYFEAYGFSNIRQVNNGKEALEILRQNPDAFDLIISDLEMPVMDGWEFARSIRSDQRLRHLPLLALTGLDGEEVEHKCLQAGFDGVEIKIDKTKVLNRVTQLLSQSKEGQKCNM